MPNNETKAVMIFRLLTPEQKAHMLEWVSLAYVAESSVRKLNNCGATSDAIYIENLGAILGRIT